MAKYLMKQNLAVSSNYSTAKATKKYINVHYTANDGDTDEANAQYFKTYRGASAHIFVDDDSATISVPLDMTAYSVGKNYGSNNLFGTDTNKNSINIELCDTKKNGIYDFTENTLDNAAAIIKALMVKYGIDINHVYRHYDVCSKSCPKPFVTSSSAWQNFKTRIVNATPGTLTVGQTFSTSTTTVTKPNTSTTTANTTLTCTATKLGVQKYLNAHYGDVIKEVLGKELSEDGAFGTNSKRGIAIAMQAELNALSANISVDGYFGGNSEVAFTNKVFTLKKGSKGIFVTLWQCFLVGMGFNPNGIDGTFGNGCITATNALFKKNGLSQDSSVSGGDVNKLL